MGDDDTPCSLLHPQATMSTKILRTSNATRAPPDEVELSVAQALIDLEASVADLKWVFAQRGQGTYTITSRRWMAGNTTASGQERHGGGAV